MPSTPAQPKIEAPFGVSAVVLILKAVTQAAQFYVGYVFEVKNFAVVERANYYLVEFFRRYQTTFIAHDVLERLVAVFAELTRCRLDVLLGKRCPAAHTAVGAL